MTSQIRVDSIVPTTGVPTGGGGGIVQIVQTVKSDAETLTSSTTETLIPGMEATISPKSLSSKILVMVVLNAYVGAAYAGQYAVLKRGTNNISVGDAAGNRNRASISLQGPNFYDVDSVNWGPGQASLHYLDSPNTTDPVTYGLYHGEADGTGNYLYINKSTTDSDTNQYNRVASSITLMEVSA
tara:strand:+ start:110 stop:661 length:552 start_codon:yes stop_codon:yes gene_type:complete